MPSVHVLLVSGRSGSGKTTTTYELCQILRDRDVGHANISADNLDEMWPEAEGSELLLANLAAMWGNYYARGCYRLVLSGTAIAINEGPINEVIEKVSVGAEVEVHSVILTAPDETAAERLGAREIGTALERHITSSNKWGRYYQEHDIGHRVSTEGKTVSEVANEILDFIGW